MHIDLFDNPGIKTEVLPKTFDYSKQTMILIVTYSDGQRVRYFDVDPRVIFLDPRNTRRNADFLRVRDNYKKEVLGRS